MEIETLISIVKWISVFVFINCLLFTTLINIELFKRNQIEEDCQYQLHPRVEKAITLLTPMGYMIGAVFISIIFSTLHVIVTIPLCLWNLYNNRDCFEVYRYLNYSK